MVRIHGADRCFGVCRSLYLAFSLPLARSFICFLGLSFFFPFPARPSIAALCTLPFSHIAAFSSRSTFSSVAFFFHRAACFLDCKFLGVLSSSFLENIIVGFLNASLQLSCKGNFGFGFKVPFQCYKTGIEVFVIYLQLIRFMPNLSLIAKLIRVFS